MAQEVLALKMVSNEEVVAAVVEDNDDHYVLNRPRSLVMNQDAAGNVTLGLLPFMASANNPESGSESDVILYKKDIMGKAKETPEPLAKHYLQTVSGIAIIQ